MLEDERWNFLVQLDEELLIGCAMLSEWASFIVREADTAFVNGAHLACILTSVAAIETHLRFEPSAPSSENLFNLIEKAEITDELRADLHSLRKYRNKWVHISEPLEDQKVLDNPTLYEQEIEKMAFFSVRTLRRTLYSNQGT
jgi:hypothetical protein